MADPRKTMMTIADAVMAGDYKNKAEVITALGELKMDLAPRFTKDAPEEAGYYWYRESNGSTIIVEVLYDNNSWMVRMLPSDLDIFSCPMVSMPLCSQYLT